MVDRQRDDEQTDSSRGAGNGGGTGSGGDESIWRSANALIWIGTGLELAVAIGMAAAAFAGWVGVGGDQVKLGAMAIGGAAVASLVASLMAREHLQRLLSLSGAGDLIINWSMQLGLPLLAAYLYFAGWFKTATALVGVMAVLTVMLAGLLACSESFREAMLSRPRDDELG